MATSDNWGQFWAVAKLEFAVYGMTDIRAARIYANSKNMVEVVITVKIVDKNSENLNVTDDEVKACLYFCQSQTGENLDSLWLTSDEPNEYVNGSSSAKFYDSDGIRHVRKYISCAKHERDEITAKISVGINVPGFGKFDTSRYGTSTEMGSGNVFKSPQAFEVTALRPIDYGIHSNITIEYGDFETIKSDVQWMSMTEEGFLAPTKEYWDGQCKRRIVYIRPNQNKTGQEKFKKYNIHYEPVYNADVSTGKIKVLPNTSAPGFALNNERGPYSSPGVVMGRGWHRDNYEVNLWYTRQSHVVLNGRFFAADNDYYYLFNQNLRVIEKNHNGEDENGAATLLLYKMIMPVSVQDKWQSHWKDVVRDVTVTVTDFYGNEGSFQLNFDEEFDEPKIKL